MSSEDPLFIKARSELQKKRVVRAIWEQAHIRADGDLRLAAKHYIMLRMAQLKQKQESTAASPDSKKTLPQEEHAASPVVKTAPQNKKPPLAPQAHKPESEPENNQKARPAPQKAVTPASTDEQKNKVSTRDVAPPVSAKENLRQESTPGSDANKTIAEKAIAEEQVPSSVLPEEEPDELDEYLARQEAIASKESAYEPGGGILDQPDGKRLVLTVGAALAALVLSTPFWLFGGKTASPLSATPTVSKSALADIAMYRNGPARTGTYAGEGPQQFNDILWSFRADSEISSPPIIGSDAIFIGADNGTVYAIGRTNGEEKWRFKADDAVVAAPIIDGNTVYIASVDSQLYALNRANGQEKWRLQTGGEIFSSPVIVDGILYIGSQDGHLYAIDGIGGQILWRVQPGNGGLDASPAVLGDTLYVGSLNGLLYALDIQNGQEKWHFTTGGAIAAAPSVTHDTVYVGNTAGALYALDSRTGRERWRAKASSAIAAEFSVVTPSALAASTALPHPTAPDLTSPDDHKSGALPLNDEADMSSFGGVLRNEDIAVYYLSIDGGLSAVDRDAFLMWRFQVDSKTFTAPIVAGSSIYFSTSDGSLYALDRKDGRTLWTNQLSNKALTTPAVADGVLYVGGADRFVYAVK